MSAKDLHKEISLSGNVMKYGGFHKLLQELEREELIYISHRLDKKGQPIFCSLKNKNFFNEYNELKEKAKENHKLLTKN